MQNPLLVFTEDGSHSLYLEHLNEHYHSQHGAILESKHIYINAGLQYVVAKKSNIQILEIGFGTGLNALLTLIESSKNNFSVHYHSVEPFPLAIDLVYKLNYLEQLNALEVKPYFEQMHLIEHTKKLRLFDNFTFEKSIVLIQNAVLQHTFDLIYFDAFAPRVQPELWTIDVFAKLFSSMNKNACLVTYCAKGEVKRNLMQAGFRVESLPGPKGKREITRAIKE